MRRIFEATRSAVVAGWMEATNQGAACTRLWAPAITGSVSS